MNFKDWCYQTFGIVEFTEGKILNCVFIPAFPQQTIRITVAIVKAGGMIIEASNARGIIIPYDNFLSMNNIFEELFDSFNLSVEPYSEWLNSYFSDLGLNLTQLYEYKEPSSIHLTFKNSQAEEYFVTRFKHFYPVYSNNPFSGIPTLALTPGIIQHLFKLYYLDETAEINQAYNLSAMQKHIDSLLQLEQLISLSYLQDRLDCAKFLARDFSNTYINGIRLGVPQAVSAYSLSLRVFAEANRDNLALIQYGSLNYAASLLAAYTPQGKLQQSLKTDAKFVSYIVFTLIRPFLKQASKSLPYIDELPEETQRLILSLIEQNLNGMLYGNPYIALNNNTCISMARFLPGRQMTSDTDELIFQGGGMKGHSAMFRIIKVGILKNGSRAQLNEMPHFFEYYKVEDNLGSGAHGIDLLNKTCTGTYVTKLEPHTLENDVYIKLDIDPYTDAIAYQNAMECTLKGLIRVERLLIFHKNPSITYNSDSLLSEKRAWVRFNAIKECLSGQVYSYPVHYYGKDPLDSSKIYQRTVCNQRKFGQEGGSCLIFSLKSLVGSIIGSELSALHTNFMQLHDAQQHLDYVASKIAILQRYISYFSSVNAAKTDSVETAQVLASNKHTFFGVQAKSLIPEGNTCIEQKKRAAY